MIINDENYVGEIYDGKANGDGTLTTEHWTFRGTFKNNERHGLGVYTWKNGTVEEGEFKNGEKEGKDTFEIICLGKDGLVTNNSWHCQG